MPKISIRVGKIKNFLKMKKLFITIAFVAATMFASAQLYVGGSLGMGFGSNKVTYDGTTNTRFKTFDFNINPNVGFMFADNMGVGLELNFAFDKTTNPKNDINPVEDIDKTTTFGVTPYFRYVITTVDNFTFYADGKVNFSTSKDKNVNDGTTTDGNKNVNFGINVVPGFAYNLTENISFNAELNILKLGWNMTKTTTPKDSLGNGTVYKNSDFGFGINEPTPIKIGFFYTF